MGSQFLGSTWLSKIVADRASGGHIRSGQFDAGPLCSAGVEIKSWQLDCFLLAWLCWSAYAVHNVANPNLALSYSTTEERPAYVAVHDALSSLSHAVMTIIGGLTYDGSSVAKNIPQSRRADDLGHRCRVAWSDDRVGVFLGRSEYFRDTEMIAKDGQKAAISKISPKL